MKFKQRGLTFLSVFAVAVVMELHGRVQGIPAEPEGGKLGEVLENLRRGAGDR